MTLRAMFQKSKQENNIFIETYITKLAINCISIVKLEQVYLPKPSFHKNGWVNNINWNYWALLSIHWHAV